MKKDEGLILLESFPNIYLAEMVKELLEGIGIKVVLRRGDTEAEGFIGQHGDADLLVLRRDYQKAKKIILAFNRNS